MAPFPHYIHLNVKLHICWYWQIYFECEISYKEGLGEQRREIAIVCLYGHLRSIYLHSFIFLISLSSLYLPTHPLVSFGQFTKPNT